MKVIAASPKLVSQVHDALVSEIVDGSLKPGERVIQEHIAQVLGVSRQPVQQALMLLRTQGVLRDAPGRGLIVAPMDPDQVRDMYDIRAMLEGLAFRRAAERSSGLARKLGPKLLRDGQAALSRGSVPALVAADLGFHGLVHELSKNPLIAPTMEAQWIYTQRVMGEVLLREDSPEAVWAQHAAMLEAVMDADGEAAERLAREHVMRAAGIVIARLRSDAPAGEAPAPAPWPPYSEFIAAPSAGSSLEYSAGVPPPSSREGAQRAGPGGDHGMAQARETPNDKRRLS